MGAERAKHGLILEEEDDDDDEDEELVYGCGLASAES
jgi:hypothetical protein